MSTKKIIKDADSILKQIEHHNNLYYNLDAPIISDSEYESISLVCTHSGGKVNEVGDGLKCSLHGSTFDKNGKLLGGKAQKDLPVYPTSAEGDNVVVKVS